MYIVLDFISRRALQEHVHSMKRGILIGYVDIFTITSKLVSCKVLIHPLNKFVRNRYTRQGRETHVPNGKKEEDKRFRTVKGVSA